jgi:hypothetical protein
MDAGEDIDQGGLAGAVLADKRVNFPFLKGEIHIHQGLCRSEGLGYIFKLQQ